MTRRYTSAIDFKHALEDRLRHRASGFGIQRRRQALVFQRLLARIASGFGRNHVLKGGLCLELRIDGARTTRDIDLAIFGDEATILPRLQTLGQLDLGDFMTFEIQPDRTHPGADRRRLGVRRPPLPRRRQARRQDLRRPVPPRHRVRRAHAG